MNRSRKSKTQHLNSLQQRLAEPNNSCVTLAQKECFVNIIKRLKLPKESKALSISTGDGMWDYLTFQSLINIKKITATDIVKNPVKEKDMTLLNSMGKWEFKKVLPEKKLSFENSSFDLIYHMDTIEHVEKPLLFLSEQYRVLKKKGILVFSTPNLFRPVNVLKIIFGKLKFPVVLGHNKEIGDYIHIQEYHEQQMTVMLKEVGFKNIVVTHCFFGLHFINLCLSKFPNNPTGKTMCHYLTFKCEK